MNKRKKLSVKRIVIIIASAAVICSSGYIVYDMVWIPYHFRKLNDSFTVSESSADSAADGALNENSVQKKYAELKAEYPDFMGKLTVEKLKMDFPVAQCADNSYYLKHTLDGVADKHGTLFADCENNLRELDQNTVLYGHNMKDNTQFGMLNVYKTVDGYKSAPVVTFNTIYRDYKWKVFASFLINTKPEDDGGYAFNYTKKDFSSEQEFSDFYNEVMERSYIITDTDVKPDDKILTMSTCSTLFDDSRLVVMARLVREGESEEADTSSARENPDQRFPSEFKTDKK